MKRLTVSAVLLLLAACQSPSDGSDSSAVAPPTPVPPLDMLTRMTLPAKVATVEEAAAYLLEPSGYRLAVSCAGCPPEAAEIARKPISPLGLKPQLTTIKRALVLIAGSDARLIVDDQRREVSFGYFHDLSGRAASRKGEGP